jgi:hypothetical protein
MDAGISYLFEKRLEQKCQQYATLDPEAFGIERCLVALEKMRTWLNAER